MATGYIRRHAAPGKPVLIDISAREIIWLPLGERIVLEYLNKRW
jgi:hypothetical protein